MKLIQNTYTLWICCLAFCLAACTKSEYGPIDNSIYIANSSNDNYKILNIDNVDINEPFQVRTAQKSPETATISVVVDEEVLNTYNQRHSSDYVMLPASFFSLDKDQVTINKGEIMGSLINLKVKPLSNELAKSGLTYAIPLKIAGSNFGTSALQTGSSFLYVIAQTPYADVPVLKRANGMKMTLANSSVTVQDFTVEFLVKMSNLALNRNNQILFNAADFPTSKGGSDGEIFTRFAADGAAGKWDKFQIKNQGKSYDATTSFVNNRWYHIACVNNNTTGKMQIYVNGVLDGSFDNAKLPTTVNSSSDRGFRFCGESDNDSYMVSNVQTAELRFWSVARTEAEIRSNMYGIKPTTPGLIGYWRANEGAGNVIKDVSGNNNNAVIFGANATWMLNQKISTAN
uniref:DUF1735 and LamG domain-containing protein n=1 Tax=Pedobacter schmidteae TaxID=2201271 RepID=UPI000EB22046|nr:DUF1735 and LamG domain-containing protein [Pedobacter schmidteae]